MKPVLLPSAATKALPRWIIIALALLYILPGLIGRDPWKNIDATNFGIIWTMAEGHLRDWFVFNIVGQDIPVASPLSYWLGAICVKIFGGIFGAPFASRISVAISFIIGSLSIWYTTYLLGRRNEAQPMQLAFGGQPSPRNYGRTLADGAFLIYLGCFGLILHSHETSPMTLQIALLSYAIYSAVRIFDMQKWYYQVTLGFALGLLVLTYGWTLPLAVLIGLLGLAVFYKNKAILAGLIGIALPIALIIFGLWLLAAYFLVPESFSSIHIWFNWNLHQINLPNWDSITYFLSNSLWFTWPAWPLALWALYAWREQPRSLHIALPLALAIPITLLCMSNHHTDDFILMPLLPPLAILAAFALPTMKRGAINAVDWFAVMILTFFAAFIWLEWIAVQTGWPYKMARNAARLSQGYHAEFSMITFVFALIATIGWGFLVQWRLSRRPVVLWRAVVLSAGGVILCWTLMMTLWLPVVNYSKSYAGVTQQMISAIPDKHFSCITTNVKYAQRASFAYFGGFEFSGTKAQPCQLLLLQDSFNNPKTDLDSDYKGAWRLLWEGSRPSDRNERFRLYQRLD